MKIRRYSELIQYSSFEDRYEYLRLFGHVGEATFGFDRHINQKFYRSRQWKQARQHAIFRDEGCDLGVPGREIHGGILVHHMNPITVEDIIDGEEWILDPQYLITTTTDTHNAIHYGDANLLQEEWSSRAPGDTRLW